MDKIGEKSFEINCADRAICKDTWECSLEDEVQSYLRPVFDNWAEATCKKGAKTGGLIEKDHEKRWFDNCCRSCCDILGITHEEVEIEASGSGDVENIPVKADDDEDNMFENFDEKFPKINSYLKTFIENL